jgi:hypothetical protein
VAGDFIADDSHPSEERGGELFLRSIVVRKENLELVGCAVPTFEDQWNGWYTLLFYQRDNHPTTFVVEC